jgi:hypothetical protein
MARLFSGAPRSLPPRRRVTGTLLTITQLGYAHWFFGNLYEAIVKVPHRLVSDQEPAAAGTRATALLGPGSPLRYYLPGAPATFAATLAALATGWDTPNDRRWLMAAAACSMAGGAIAAYLVRTVNLPLFFTDQSLAPDEQDRLLRTWYRLNGSLPLAARGWPPNRPGHALTDSSPPRGQVVIGPPVAALAART